MDKLSYLVDEGYHVTVFKNAKGYFVGMDKQISEDSFEEWETSCFKSVEQAIDEAFRIIKEDTLTF